MTTKLCPCGRPLHYLDSRAEENVCKMVSERGECVKVSALVVTRVGPPQDIPGQPHLEGRFLEMEPKSWMVPRHWIALHGLGRDLPQLAAKYGWEEVE